MASRRTLLLAVLCASPCAAPAVSRAETVHFLVGEIPGSEFRYDSYVLPLSDAAAIDHARQLIADGPSAGATIASARIMPGADGINGDYLPPGLQTWSWHVSEFLDFADFTIELCDGNPTYLENDVDGWIANTGGQICFWNYTVIDELEIVPEPATLELLSGGLVVAMWVACRRRRQSVGSAVGR